MMILSEDLVAPGGPSAPVWTFFTAISLALIGVLSAQIAAKREAKETKKEAIKANENASQARENTVNISNGFVARIDSKLDRIQAQQVQTNRSLQKHLEWHLDNDKDC